jgi:hypothetical protein
MTEPRASTEGSPTLPDYAPVPNAAFGPALNEQGYDAGRVERRPVVGHRRRLQAAFLTTSDGVVLFDAPPTIGHSLQRAIDEIARSS